jgi:5-methyltetrahydropteroyltriglutamate--homocysteine methyltransferase
MSKQKTYIVGYPRIGEQRELKKALEGFWAGKTGTNDLLQTSKELRKNHWLAQQRAGIDFISSNDFSLYDSMLDTACMLGAVPERFSGIVNPLEQYFAMARGTQNAAAMEMTKWFNTNYHYIVPELSSNDRYSLNTVKLLEEYNEAKQLGIRTKINLIGPLTFLLLSKRIDGNRSMLELLPAVLPEYIALVKTIGTLDNEITVQFDEPVLVKGADAAVLEALRETYRMLAAVSPKVKIVIMTYFDHALEAVKALADIPIWGIGLDFVYGTENISALRNFNGKQLIAGVVDGRNIWRNSYQSTHSLLGYISGFVRKENIIVSTSCSLLHVPYTIRNENKLDTEIWTWMSFAEEKLEEVTTLARLFASDFPKSDPAYFTNINVMQSKSNSHHVTNEQVRERVRTNTNVRRKETHEERRQKQAAWFPDCILPTTTIGSFPQTQDLRKLRKDYKNGTISKETYDTEIRREIDQCVAFQENIGLDVLVHGELERNDMVEYFGEQLKGFAFTENGWVQSYGSRCVKPPVIFGDIFRPSPMTVDIIAYAQNRTRQIMKGMLTGPVTILNWSFVRNDLERSKVCEQIALALSDEVADLQSEGIKIIQVDEAAFKEGYPLRKEKIPEYENWAVKAFQLTVAAAKPETQIHTHMCYSEFSDIFQTLQRLDADVLTIETSRSGDSLLNAFRSLNYKNEIGPGVYDIHSPRIPTVEEYEEKIRMLSKIFPVKQLWINPDCGLKTRTWKEVEPSLQNMVTAVRNIRKELA